MTMTMTMKMHVLLPVVTARYYIFILLILQLHTGYCFYISCRSDLRCNNQQHYKMISKHHAMIIDGCSNQDRTIIMNNNDVVDDDSATSNAFSVSSSSSSSSSSRRSMLYETMKNVLLFTSVSSSVFQSTAAYAEVASGNSLPQGAQQFARVVRLKSDVLAIQKRLLDVTTLPIDDKEWDNISQFLRIIYKTAEEDMKFTAKSIYDNDKKTAAFNSIEQIKKYAQAGDISIRKKDNTNLALIMNQCIDNINIFFDALQDVPDEL